ncbi:MAG: putative lipase LipH [marine bacterium B5-7]|nr:MAG: putative lipase LipH [marine bacterium B5-7]
MQLESEIAAFARMYESFEPLDADAARDPARYQERYRRLAAAIETSPPDGVSREDAVVISAVGEIPIRIYRRYEVANAPCCLFFHGGGWTLGDIDTHDAWAADLCADSGATVIATDYRLAPDARYPAAFDDCYAVFNEVSENSDRYSINPERIAVYGDSAGGNLAAAVSLKARDLDKPGICGQVLVYPALHYGSPLPSWLANRDAPILSLKSLEACWAGYLGGVEPDAYAAPLLADRFDNLPSAWIIAAEHDPLHDDGLFYAKALRDAGVFVELLDCSGLVHGCFRVRHGSATTRVAYQFSVSAVRKALNIDIVE